MDFELHETMLIRPNPACVKSYIYKAIQRLREGIIY
jgi:hypothetical protein